MRIDNKTMWILGFFLAFIFILGCAGYIVLYSAGGGNFPWVRFYLNGKESGFALREINILRRAAVEIRMEDPTSLFWSIKKLDQCIKEIVINYRAKGEESKPEVVSFISKLYDFRKKVEFNQPKYNMGIKNSHEIMKRQRMKLSLPNLGPFTSLVVENMRRYMAIAYPKGPKLPVGFSWKGQQLGISFWRRGDAGYFFRSKVLDDFAKQKKYPILHIAHSEEMTRMQKRKSVRADVKTMTQLYPLSSIDEANEEFEEDAGLKSVLIDISEEGASLLIGGRAKVGVLVKLQFTLSGRSILMCGVVTGVNYDTKKNRSLLHIRALPPSPRIKNLIRAYVYDIFGERDRSKTGQDAPQQRKE